MQERREKETLSANYKTDFNTYYAPVTSSYQPENYNPNGQFSVHHLQTTTQVRKKQCCICKCLHYKTLCNLLDFFVLTQFVRRIKRRDHRVIMSGECKICVICCEIEICQMEHSAVKFRQNLPVCLKEIVKQSSICSTCKGKVNPPPFKAEL